MASEKGAPRTWESRHLFDEVYTAVFDMKEYRATAAALVTLRCSYYRN